MSQREDALKFETGRIKALQEERLHIQKKTFTKWMNSFLVKARMEVEDLFTDLGDGKKLLKLLEIISGEKLGKPNNGKMRVHHIENVNKSLAFLHTKVRLESIGAEDIVDGNPRLILGLIWTIILRFQIQEIEIDVDEEDESSEKRSAKDALLLWCQRKTNGYNHVNIQDFTGSWRSGLGFNALIHAHRPDLFNYDQLIPTRHIDNLNHAFDVAEKDLGIPRLLDAEDIDTAKPDEKSVLTYVASYYHTFARMKNEMKGGRRIANIMGQIMTVDKAKTEYETVASGLLEWIQQTIHKLNDRTFANTPEGVQSDLSAFKNYRTVEKPPRYKEKSNLLATFFNINSRLKELNQSVYVPAEGLSVQEVERAWEALESAEYKREKALKEELLRLTALEELAQRFERKSELREGYLRDMIGVLSDPRYGNAGNVEATLKKHEAICADVMAREPRCLSLQQMSTQLTDAKYHAAAKIQKRAEQIMTTWRELLALLDSHRVHLNTQSNLMACLRETDTVLGTVKDLHKEMGENLNLSHLSQVEDLLSKHGLRESEVQSVGGAIARIEKRVDKLDPNSGEALANRLATLKTEYEELKKESKGRRNSLEAALQYYRFVEDAAEEQTWVLEKRRACSARIKAKDLRALQLLQQKHKTVQDELRGRWPKCQRVLQNGADLKNGKWGKEVTHEIKNLEELWNALREDVTVRGGLLKGLVGICQFQSDLNECESWLKEKEPLVTSTDCGADEPSAQALLQRHKALQGEIKAYNVDIKSLTTVAASLADQDQTLWQQQNSPTLSNGTSFKEDESEDIERTEMVPEEYYDTEKVERVEYKTAIEERAVPQVKALYPFQGQEISAAKGEVLFLLNKTNNDWWNVRKADGTDGFMPANYVREIEPKVVQVQVRKPETVVDVKKVKKTRMVPRTVKTKAKSKPSPTKRQSSQAQEEPVEVRMNKLNEQYNSLVKNAERRHDLLLEWLATLRFFRECDDFESWIAEQVELLSTNPKVDKSAERDNVSSLQRRFEKFLTDLSAAAKTLESIDKKVEGFRKNKHSQMGKIEKRQASVHSKFERLLRLKKEKEKSLASAFSLDHFEKTCDQTKEWMGDKWVQMEQDDLKEWDLKSVQALQRRHLRVERELEPVKLRVDNVINLGDTVKKQYPEEGKRIETRVDEIKALYADLLNKSDAKRKKLESAAGKGIFLRGAKDVINFLDSVKDKLNSKEVVNDVSAAEDALKAHEELGEEIRGKGPELVEIVELGQGLSQKDPEVVAKLEELKSLHSAVQLGFTEKASYLQQLLDLQMFLREADHLDAISGNQMKILSQVPKLENLEQVEMVLRAQTDLENTLAAQEERVALFEDMSGKLQKAGHSESAKIKSREEEVIAKRNQVKNLAKKRREGLEQALRFHSFASEVADTSNWVAEKERALANENVSLARAVVKHEAFIRELGANEGKLRSLTEKGETLKKALPDYKDQIEDLLRQLQQSWKNLERLSSEKTSTLKHAEAEKSYLETLEDLRGSVSKLRREFTTESLGTDRRSTRELLRRQAVAEQELVQARSKMDELIATANEMKKSKNVNKQVKACVSDLESLQGPCDERKRKLEERSRILDFLFEVDAERIWVEEKKNVVEAFGSSNGFHQAQRAVKRFAKVQSEIGVRKDRIESVIKKGETFPKNSEIQPAVAGLAAEWKSLQKLCKQKESELEESLRAHSYFYDANEVESWTAEKIEGLKKNRDKGKDKDSVVKLLKRQKSLELELDTYQGLVREMASVATQLIESNHPESTTIKNRQKSVEEGLRTLSQLTSARRRELMDSMQRHEYFVEAQDLEKWAIDNIAIASSEDYGQDYEHLLLLQSRFVDFKQSVESSSHRFKNLKDLGKKLIAAENPHADQISAMEERLGDDMEPVVSVQPTHEVICKLEKTLHSALDAREQKLKAAGEIHKFNRDVAEALACITEKNAALPEGIVPKDLQSCERLLRDHEGFENDLVALESQLQTLLNDGGRLRKEYVSNAANIEEEQNLVLDQWNELKTKAAAYKDSLHNALLFHSLNNQMRPLEQFAGSALNELKSSKPLPAHVEQETFKTLRSETETRLPLFDETITTANSLVQENHPMKKEIQAKAENLEAKKKALLNSLDNKKSRVDELLDYEAFLRESRTLEGNLNRQIVLLTAREQLASVEECEALLRKLETISRVLEQQNEKLAILKQQGGRLISQDHFEKEKVEQKLNSLEQLKEKVDKLFAERKTRLNRDLQALQFERDALEALQWMEEREKRMSGWSGDVVSLEDKVKRLERYQGFLAEVDKNRNSIEDIVERGKAISSKGDKQETEKTRELTKNVENKWKQLQEKLASFGKGLSEAESILKFKTELEKTESYLRAKEKVLSTRDLGRDLEHCNELIRRLEDPEMRVDSERIEYVNKLGSKLKDQDPSVVKALDRVNSKWQDMRGALESYRADLGKALHVHSFVRDVEDVRGRVNEKGALLKAPKEEKVEEKSLPSVERSLRQQEAVETEMGLIGAKVQDLDTKASTLSKEHPNYKDLIEKKNNELRSDWNELSQLCVERKCSLSDLVAFLRWSSNVSDYVSWTEETVAALETEIQPSTEKERLQEGVAEFTTAINGNKEQRQKLTAAGKDLLRAGNAHSENVKHKLEELENAEKRVLQALKDREKKIQELLIYLNFSETATQRESEMNSIEAQLSSDLPDTLDTLAERKMGHLEIKKSVDAIDLKSLEKYKLPVESEYSDPLLERKESVVSRHENLTEQVNKRTQLLNECEDYLRFLKQCAEVEGWIWDKMKTAKDESYSDLCNLQSKQQRHDAFKTEVSSRSKWVGEVANRAKELTHIFASQSVSAKADEIKSLHQELIRATEEKSTKLIQAMEAFVFQQGMEDIVAYTEELEGVLNSGDHGNDLESCLWLLEKFKGVENGYAEKEAVLTRMSKSLATELKDNFKREDLQKELDEVNRRYRDLSDPLNVRRENLEAAWRLFEFLEDSEELRQYLDEKKKMAQTTDFGDNVDSVRRLIKKHVLSESELKSRERVLLSLTDRGTGLVKSGHFAETQISDKCKELNSLYKDTVDLYTVRKLRLEDSLLSQSLFAELSELEGTITERLGSVDSVNGKTEGGCSSALKKLQGIDVDSLGQLLAKLEQTGKGLLDRGHFASDEIKTRLEHAKNLYVQLELSVEKKRQRLQDLKSYFFFVRHCAETSEWISENTVIAGSEDYGRDLEHVQVLIGKFDKFYEELMISGNGKVADLQSKLVSFQQESHPDGDKMLEKLTQVEAQWEELKELAAARKDALNGAKQVHTFDRRAEDVVEWIEERRGVSEESQRVAALGTELETIKERIKDIEKEGDALVSAYPDAAEHIEAKKQEMDVFADLEAEYRGVKAKLERHGAHMEYLKNLNKWVQWMDVKRTSVAGDLGVSVSAAQAQLEHLRNVRVAILARESEVTSFVDKGKDLLSGDKDSDFLSDRVRFLEGKWKDLLAELDSREQLYEQNVDARTFFVEAERVERWMSDKEREFVDAGEKAKSVEEVEALISKFEQFQGSVSAQGERIKKGLERITLIEEEFKNRTKKASATDVKPEKVNEVWSKKDRRGTEVIAIPEGVASSWKDSIRRGSDPVGLKDHTLQLPFSHTNSSGSTETGLRLPESLPHGAKSGGSFRTPTGKQNKAKRTPSFTTRRRTHSFRKDETDSTKQDGSGQEKNKEVSMNLLQGYLERKSVLQSGGKRAPVRSWRGFNAYLTKDNFSLYKEDSRSPSFCAQMNEISVVERASDYIKKRFVFRLVLTDGGVMLFSTDSEDSLNRWVDALNKELPMRPPQPLLRPRSREPLCTDLNEEFPSTPAAVTNGHNGNGVQPAVPPPPMIQPRMMEKPPVPPRTSSVLETHTSSPKTLGVPSESPQGTLKRSTSPGSGSSRESTMDSRKRRGSESSSETESRNNSNPKGQGLMGLFRRKKATQL